MEGGPEIFFELDRMQGVGFLLKRGENGLRDDGSHLFCPGNLEELFKCREQNIHRSLGRVLVILWILEERVVKLIDSKLICARSSP
jgi:hypothetical protein